jgi:aryl-alcohol dehydrogenase-like predicted oxidoreductase
MKQIQIANTDLRVSRLSFGTASLHHLMRQSERQALLQQASDAGFTHFDTSPYYGTGLAERTLGSMPAAWRQRVTLASKVGLYSPAGALGNVPDMLARKVLGKFLPVLNKAVVDWSVARAQRSLELSLRRLGRGHLDLLYLHEPDAALIKTDEWLGWVQAQVKAGRIRYWGLAGEAPCIAAMLAQAAPLAAVIQVRDSLGQRQADVVLNNDRPLQFTYGYLSQLAQPDKPAEATLREALARNTTGSLIVSTRRRERIASLANCGEA